MNGTTSKKILFIGYGNPDRQDDGVAWHILCGLAEKFSRPVPQDFQEGFPEDDENPKFFFELQLMPEHAELVGQADLVVFIDAHTGNVPEDLFIKKINPHFQNSPFTHHLTPETCLSLAETMYGRLPEAWLATVRGFEFGFSHELSPATKELANDAVNRIFKLLAEY